MKLIHLCLIVLNWFKFDSSLKIVWAYRKTVNFPKYLLFLFERHRKKAETQTKSLHLLIHSPNAHHGQGWARMNWSQNSVLCMQQEPNTWANNYCHLQCTLSGNRKQGQSQTSFADTCIRDVRVVNIIFNREYTHP